MSRPASVHVKKFTRTWGKRKKGDDRLFTIEISQRGIDWLREACAQPLSGCDPMDEDKKTSEVRRQFWDILNQPHK